MYKMSSKLETFPLLSNVIRPLICSIVFQDLSKFGLVIYYIKQEILTA